MNAVQCGLRRGRIEFGNSIRAGTDIAYYVITSLIVLVVLWLNRDNTIPGTDHRAATEREDGTLLRLKSVPGGMTGYVVGQMLRTTLEIAFSMVILLIPASFFVSGLSANGVAGWMEAIGFLLLGLLAVLPLGFVIGSVFKNPRSVGGWGMLVMIAIIWVSGIFGPLAAMAGWVQVLGQLTPTYWLGLGLRSALLPESAATVEIDGSWRTLLAVGVLLGWALVGFLLAPPLLRRMARRESGSSVAARREKALQRV
jgi:ABC-2 type transport system permease protein